MKKLIMQIIKFGIVGVIAFCVDYIFLLLFTEVINIHPTISTGLSFVISLIVNYLLSMRFVFKVNANISKQKEIIIFVVTSCIGLGINVLMMHFGYDVWHFDYRFVKIVATFVVMIWNYISKKILLEGKKVESEGEAN